MKHASNNPPAAASHTVPRRANLTNAQFCDEYLFPNRPVIIEDALLQWDAVGKWSPEFFQQKFGARQLRVDDEVFTIHEFVDRVLDADVNHPAPYLKGTGEGNYFVDLFPELTEDIEPTPLYLFPNWLAERYMFGFLTRRLNRGPQAEIFFGGQGSGFPVLHWDSLYFHAFNCQVDGTKDWCLFAPDQTEFLYVRKEAQNQSQVERVFDPDLDRYPRLVHVTRYECTTAPGEMLFLPAGWWHTTRLTGPSISIAVNMANGSNWDGVRHELVAKAQEKSRLLAAILDNYLKIVERQKSHRDQRALS